MQSPSIVMALPAEYRVSHHASTESVAKDTDKELVRRVQKGDLRAFDLLFSRYQYKIVNLVSRFLRDPEDVQDVVQEAFIKAYRALPRFRGDSAFYTRLYRIAINTAKKTLMDFKRDPTVSEASMRQSDDEDETSYRKNEPTSPDTPDTVLAAKQISNAVNVALEALPDDLRQAVTLREIEGMSYEDIAEMMQCPIGTVRSRIFRAREAISARVKPLLENQSGKRW